MLKTLAFNRQGDKYAPAVKAAVESVLFGLQMVLAYACMLLVMTYDTLIATATILGLVVGYFINLVGCWPLLIAP